MSPARPWTTVLLALAAVGAVAVDLSVAAERQVTSHRGIESDVVVRNVRLVDGPPLEELPTGVVKFDVFNEGVSDLQTVTLEIAILDTPPVQGDEAPLPNLLVGPIRVRTKSALKAGYSVHYELRLRNFSTACDCAATVDVIHERDRAQHTSPATFPLP